MGNYKGLSRIPLTSFYGNSIEGLGDLKYHPEIRTLKDSHRDELLGRTSVRTRFYTDGGSVTDYWGILYVKETPDQIESLIQEA